MVNLRYDQVINSLQKLCTEQSINYMKNLSQNVSHLYNSKTGEDINQNQDENINNNVENSNNIENMNEDKNINIEDHKDDINTNQNNIQNNVKPSEQSSNAVTIHEKLEYQEGENNDISNNKINNDNNNINNENNINNDSSNLNNDNSNINNNININDNSNMNNNSSNIYNNNSISLLDPNEEKKLIQSYKEYLSQAEKTIDALFLMKSKNDFLQMIRDKANEFEDANKTMRIIKRYQDKNKKNKNNISKSMVLPKDSQNSELEYCADDIENSKENEIQEKIFRTYMNAERRKMEKFINNEKEGRMIRNKDS